MSLNGDQQPKIFGTVQSLPLQDQMTMLGGFKILPNEKTRMGNLNTDALTSCASRRHFLEQAEQELLRAHRYGGELDILGLDPDHFKAINDQYGHHTGGSDPKKLVAVCQELLRDVDIIGRLGGEEFAVLLPETGSKQALEIAQRLCRAVAINPLYSPNMISLSSD